MTSRSRSAGRSPRPPLDAAALEALALGYLGRYATTRAKLVHYLRRKLAERGWAGEDEPPVTAVTARCAALGYVDDAAFAEARSAALARRGYGARRIGQALRAAGIAAEDADAMPPAGEDEALAAILAFARRRRIGPFADTDRPPDQRRRDLAAVLRAGHAMTLARRIVFAAPGDVPEAAVDR